METSEKKIDAMNQRLLTVDAKPAEPNTEDQTDPNNWTVIYAYTRAQAIEDGVLADVSEMAKKAGFRYPVALTHAVYVQYVKAPEGITGQDENGRLWDILSMCANRVRRSEGESILFFDLYVRNNKRSHKRVTLKAVCGANDDASPCITVMMPDED